MFEKIHMSRYTSRENDLRTVWTHLFAWFQVDNCSHPVMSVYVIMSYFGVFNDYIIEGFIYEIIIIIIQSISLSTPHIIFLPSPVLFPTIPFLFNRKSGFVKFFCFSFPISSQIWFFTVSDFGFVFHLYLTQYAAQPFCTCARCWRKYRCKRKGQGDEHHCQRLKELTPIHFPFGLFCSLHLCWNTVLQMECESERVSLLPLPLILLTTEFIFNFINIHTWVGQSVILFL